MVRGYSCSKGLTTNRVEHRHSREICHATTAENTLTARDEWVSCRILPCSVSDITSHQPKLFSQWCASPEIVAISPGRAHRLAFFVTGNTNIHHVIMNDATLVMEAYINGN